jgi:uncharacterized protein YjfI (DUF2170 family)
MVLTYHRKVTRNNIEQSTRIPVSSVGPLFDKEAHCAVTVVGALTLRSTLISVLFTLGSHCEKATPVSLITGG